MAVSGLFEARSRLTSEGSLYHFLRSYLSLRNSLKACSSFLLGSLSLLGSHRPIHIIRAIWKRREGGREEGEGGRNRRESWKEIEVKVYCYGNVARKTSVI